MNWNELQTLLKRPIAFQRVFATVSGGALNGLFLSQLYYWSDGRTADPDGWLYKSQDEWFEETALTRYEQETARKSLRDKGILEERKRGLPCRLYYRLNKARLLFLLGELCRQPADKDGGKPHTGEGENPTQVGGNPADRSGAFQHAITETTSETTTETTPESPDKLCVVEDPPRTHAGRRGSSFSGEFSDREEPDNPASHRGSSRPQPQGARRGGIAQAFEDFELPDSVKAWYNDAGEYIGPSDGNIYL